MCSIHGIIWYYDCMPLAIQVKNPQATDRAAEPIASTEEVMNESADFYCQKLNF